MLRSAKGGCHLCTLIVEALEPPVIEDMLRIEARWETGNGLKGAERGSSYNLKINAKSSARLHSKERDAKGLRGLFKAIRLKMGTKRQDMNLEVDFWLEVILPHRVVRPRLSEEEVVDSANAASWTYYEPKLSFVLRKDSDSHPPEDASVSTASAASFAQAKSWLNDCLMNHHTCRTEHTISRAGHTRQPARFIDVGASDGKFDCRLYLTSQHDRPLEYVALSHRWGGASVLKLTKTTFGTMCSNIRLELLPPTFRDAVSITRKLGYRYLWIDSLCIIQDDPSDWYRESQCMASVYASCVFTIAALWGTDSNAGCFIERNPLTTQACCVGDWPGGKLFATSENRNRGQILDLVRPEPLFERGWVLQERLLSPRTIYYGPWELHWECREREANETTPDQVTFGWQGRSLKERLSDLAEFAKTSQRRLPGMGRDLVKGYHDDTYTSAYEVWTAIRDSYWNSSLTFHSDSLIAISGIASTIEDATWMTYASGLWLEFFPVEILWSVRNPSETSRAFLCESWSWANVKGAKLAPFDRRLLSKRGCNIRISIEPRERRMSWSVGYPGASGYVLTVRGLLFHTTLERNSFGTMLPQDSRLRRYRFLPDFDILDKCEVFCLLVIQWDDGHHLDTYDPMQDQPGCAGLMLRQLDCDASKYERVGYWDYEMASPNEEIMVEGMVVKAFRFV
ncbi:MAG: hypothetical protein Q9218_005151 [Villophora microphyllina]